MRIALISPAGAMHRYNGLFSKNLHYAPITLMLLAAMVPPDLQPDVEIFDETAGPIPLDLEADVIGITAVTGSSMRAYKYAGYFRRRGIPVIMGGPHASLCPQEAKQHVDAVVVGLGDGSWPRALRDARDGKLQPFYYAAPEDTIAGRPLPRRDLLKHSRYITMNTVEAVRGCQINCAFCAYPAAFGRHPLTRPVPDVIAEIKSLRGKSVVFPDVNLAANRAYLVELLTAMIPLKKWWLGLTTSNVPLDEDLAALFERSGCKGLLIGFESVNAGSQKEMRKGVNRPDQYKELMDVLHRHGIMVMGCFAFGADEDGPDVFERTVRMVDETKIDLPRYAIFTPFPNTDYYRQLEAEHRITEHDWALYDVEHCVFRPKQMSKQQLEDGIRWAWAQSYGWKSMFRRWQWRNPKIFWFGWFYFLVNIGYRRYARQFEAYGAAVMTDNSDIP